MSNSLVRTVAVFTANLALSRRASLFTADSLASVAEAICRARTASELSPQHLEMLAQLGVRVGYAGKCATLYQGNNVRCVTPKFAARGNTKLTQKSQTALNETRRSGQ